jgi:hypothetical protein
MLLEEVSNAKHPVRGLLRTPRPAPVWTGVSPATVLAAVASLSGAFVATSGSAMIDSYFVELP